MKAIAATCLVAGIVGVLGTSGCKKKDSYDSSKAGPSEICDKLRAMAKEDKDEDGKRGLESCNGQLNEIKDVSSSALGCIARCPEQHPKYKDAGTCIDACMKDDPAVVEHQKQKSYDADKSRDAKGADEKVDKEKTVLDWATAPAKSFDASMKPAGGKGDRKKLSVDLIDKFAEDIGARTDTSRRYQLEDKTTGAAVTLSIAPIADPKLADAVAEAEKQKKTVIKQEARGKGYYLSTDADGAHEIILVTIVGGAAFRCEGRLHKGITVDHKDVFGPWLEKICGSLQEK